MSNLKNVIVNENCLSFFSKLKDEFVDVVYMDPPFFTQRTHKQLSRDNLSEYSFDDIYDNLGEYLSEIKNALIESKRVLKKTGSVFLHCDKTASHHLRVLLDDIFGEKNFQSEIIWSYKRWSNSKKGLLNSHQVIFFYSKTVDFKFNTLYTEYSATTNVDQILQERVRNEKGKTVYKIDEDGQIVKAKEKKGVPLSDVWEIPFLNPKATERCGYPTQKPVILLQKILSIATDEGDLVLDPFCGSGSTCVAAKSMNRNFIGVDKNPDAVKLAEKRLKEMKISESHLLNNGIECYQTKTEDENALLKVYNAIPVQRNKGIDGLINDDKNKKVIPLKIQRKNESLKEAISLLKNASKGKTHSFMILIQTHEDEDLNFLLPTIIPETVKVIPSPSFILSNLKK